MQVPAIPVKWYDFFRKLTYFCRCGFKHGKQVYRLGLALILALLMEQSASSINPCPALSGINFHPSHYYLPPVEDLRRHGQRPIALANSYAKNP
jgi:hypothetical protein